MKLLDTDTCIGILRGRDQVLERRNAERDEVVTSWITAGELFFGASRSRAPVENSASVLRLLDSMTVIGMDLASARIFGELKANLSKVGAIVADADLFIASIALSRGASIVTGNRRHFDRVAGLTVEDWLRPDAAGR